MKYIIQHKTSYSLIIDKIINQKKDLIFKFFQSDIKELNFNIYLYKDRESLVKGLQRRGYYNDPDYMCACFKDLDNSLNFFEPKDNPTDLEWSKEEYETVIFHELIHGIQFLLFGSMPEWLNEGISKYLDDTYSKGVKWILENYINKRKIPLQEEIENEFGYHEYDSYHYAYLMVSYLIETLGQNDFILLLKDKERLAKIKNNLLNRAVEYYQNKYFN